MKKYKRRRSAVPIADNQEQMEITLGYAITRKAIDDNLYPRHRNYKRRRSAVPIANNLPEENLIERILLWREISGESIANFGKHAAGDTKIWYDILAGRRLQDATRERVLVYLRKKMCSFASTMKFIMERDING